ncbi:unnamed protein product, partial [Prorocentrum cordatum]
MGAYGALRTADALHPLDELRTCIGRYEGCDLRMEARGISRFHAELVFTAGGREPTLCDLGSSNGTFVNGERLAAREPRRLLHGDVLHFSAFERASYRLELSGGVLVGAAGCGAKSSPGRAPAGVQGVLQCLRQLSHGAGAGRQAGKSMATSGAWNAREGGGSGRQGLDGPAEAPQLSCQGLRPRSQNSARDAPFADRCSARISGPVEPPKCRSCRPGLPPPERPALAATLAALAAGEAAPAAPAAEAAAEAATEGAVQPRPGVVQLTAVPLLLTLLKDLRAQAEAGLAIDGSMTRWCQDARGQTARLEQTLRRQASEAGSAARQVVLESKRLISEASLINATTDEKEEQLKDSTAAAQDASTQLMTERRQLETMLEAAGHAVDFLGAGPGSGDQPPAAADHSLDAELVSSLAQLQHVAGIGGPSQEVLSGQGGQGQGAGAWRLRETLVRLQGELRRGLAAAASEEQDVKQKHWIFADHLNSSVMEIQSQIAAVKMQAAQRKRERLRLEARIGELTALLAAAAEGSRATDAACANDDKQRKEIAEHIKAQSATIRSMLEQAAGRGRPGTRRQDRSASVQWPPPARSCMAERPPGGRPGCRGPLKFGGG